MTNKNSRVHVAVIGAGPAGYAAGFKAADLGLRVTLVDREYNPGGVCLYRGCIPSKALLHVAKVIHEADKLSNCGILFSKPKINVDKLRTWKESVVSQLTSGLGQLSKVRDITFIQGTAQFKNSTTVSIHKNDGSQLELNVDYTIIAVGSEPINIPGFPDISEKIMDSTEALDIQDIPKSMLVVGGGYIGLELASVYNALGTNVTVAEMTSGLLPGTDRDMASILEKQIKNRSITVFLNTRVEALKELKGNVRVKFSGDSIEKTDYNFDKVLIAIGRKPNANNIGLENTRVNIDSRGFITVDPQRRSTDPSIFAVGDITGDPMLAHKGSHEGIVAAEVIAGEKVEFAPHAIPAVVFTDPELAWCGLTETEAKSKNVDVEIKKFPWAASGRATTCNRTDGLTKLIIDPDSGRILGVGICGPGAGELIAEGALAIEMAASASDLKLVIHPHPTLSETIMESAELFYGPSTHMFRPEKNN